MSIAKKVKCFVGNNNYKRLFAKRLMCRLICNLPELSIRICDPKLIQIIHTMEVKRIENPYIICCRIANH